MGTPSFKGRYSDGRNAATHIVTVRLGQALEKIQDKLARAILHQYAGAENTPADLLRHARGDRIMIELLGIRICFRATGLGNFVARERAGIVLIVCHATPVIDLSNIVGRCLLNLRR